MKSLYRLILSGLAVTLGILSLAACNQQPVSKSLSKPANSENSSKSIFPPLTGFYKVGKTSYLWKDNNRKETYRTTC